MEWTWTLCALFAGLALVGASAIGTRRRPRRLGEVSFIPWNGLMFLGLTAALFGAVHLLTLAGGR